MAQFASTNVSNTCAVVGSAFSAFNINSCTFVSFNKALEINSSNVNPKIILSSFLSNNYALSASSCNMISVESCVFNTNTIKSAEITNTQTCRFKKCNIFGTSQIGIDLFGVNIAIVEGGFVKNCLEGIKARTSNVFLRSCAVISNNVIGVKYSGNSAAIYSLNVGDVLKASIVNNSLYGVEGENIILNADAVSMGQGANDFYNNGLRNFKICYTSPSFIPYTIPLRGNYWGGSAIPPTSSIEITYNNCTQNVPYDVLPIATVPVFCAEDPNPDGPMPLLSELNSDCEDVFGNNAIGLSEAFYEAYNELLLENYLDALTYFQPVSEQKNSSSISNSCRHLCHIAYTLTQNDANLSQNSLVVKDAKEVLTNINFDISDILSIYPNPSGKNVWMKNKSKDIELHIQILDAKGRIIIKDILGVQNERIWQGMEKGVYIIHAINSNTNEILSVSKQIIH